MALLTVFESIHTINFDLQDKNPQTIVEFEDDFEEEEEVEELFLQCLFQSEFINNLILKSSKFSYDEGSLKKGHVLLDPKPPRFS